MSESLQHNSNSTAAELVEAVPFAEEQTKELAAPNFASSLTYLLTYPPSLTLLSCTAPVPVDQPQ